MTSFAKAQSRSKMVTHEMLTNVVFGSCAIILAMVNIAVALQYSHLFFQQAIVGSKRRGTDCALVSRNALTSLQIPAGSATQRSLRIHYRAQKCAQPWRHWGPGADHCRFDFGRGAASILKKRESAWRDRRRLRIDGVGSNIGNDNRRAAAVGARDTRRGGSAESCIVSC